MEEHREDEKRVLEVKQREEWKEKWRVMGKLSMRLELEAERKGNRRWGVSPLLE